MFLTCEIFSVMWFLSDVIFIMIQIVVPFYPCCVHIDFVKLLLIYRCFVAA